MLTSRDRLLRHFAGKPVDRFPIWLLFPWHNMPCYTDVWNNPCYQPIIKRILAGDVDSFDRRGVNRGIAYNANPDIKIEHVVRQQGRNIVHEDIMHTPKGTFTKHISRGGDGADVKFYVDDPQQLYDLMSIPYVAPKPDIALLHKEREEFGDNGLFMMDAGDPLSVLYELMSATDFSMATATDYDVLLEYLDCMEGRVLELYRYLLENDAADCYFIVGAEFAGPPLVSPKRFTELSVRYVKKICDLIRSYGKISIVHYHGNLLSVREGMREIGPDGLHTVEQPPIGDCTLTQAREVLGKDTALIGPVQYDDLIRLPGDEIEEQVKDAFRQASDGKFILSPTAGPYEETISDHAVENYLRFIDAGLKYGKME